MLMKVREGGRESKGWLKSPRMVRCTTEAGRASSDLLKQPEAVI